jgi:hypothetical protein
MESREAKSCFLFRVFPGKLLSPSSQPTAAFWHFVARTSKSAVSRVSKPAWSSAFQHPPIGNWRYSRFGNRHYDPAIKLRRRNQHSSFSDCHFKVRGQNDSIQP